MNIGLDYDDTFTVDPQGWASFANMMTDRGHKVYITTWRDEAECVRVMYEMQYWKVDIERICPLNHKAKAKTMWEGFGVIIDVWVDDNPRSVIQDMLTL